MGLTQLLVPFLATWLAIHVFLFLLQRFLNRPKLPTGPGFGQDYELLPTTASSAQGQSSPGSGPGSKASASASSSGLLVQPFHVRFSTTSLNSFFFKLGSAPRLAQFWRVWYGLGVGFGMLAMVAGFALLGYAAVSLVSLAISDLLALWPSSNSTAGTLTTEDGVASTINRLRKRDMAPEAAPQTWSVTEQVYENKDDMVFVPVIPGVTLPLSHLPYYLIALLVSAILHEAGHAIAAAREKTQVLSSGIFLYILYPGAFVDISPRALAAMTPLQQLKVICAGVWHNAVLFVLAWAFLASGALELAFRVAGWRHMTDGLSVVDVASSSPLFGYLKAGNIVTKLNDISLQGDPLFTWNRSLLDSTSEEAIGEASRQLGFCIPNNLLYIKPVDCCLFTTNLTFGSSEDLSLSCFTPIETPWKAPIAGGSNSDERISAPEGQCLTSVDILARPNPQRCSTAQDPSCDKGSTCLRPFHAFTTAAMTRLHYTSPSWMSTPSDQGKKGDGTVEQVVLYQGDPKDIWEAVQVTSMGTRWSFLPLWLPNAILLTIRYTMSFSLALSLLNIVPARHLDGHHALKAAAAFIYMVRQSYRSTQSLSESLLENMADHGGPTAAGLGLTTASFPKAGSRAVKGIVMSTTILLVFVMVGSMLQMIVTLIRQ